MASSSSSSSSSRTSGTEYDRIQVYLDGRRKKVEMKGLDGGGIRLIVFDIPRRQSHRAMPHDIPGLYAICFDDTLYYVGQTTRQDVFKRAFERHKSCDEFQKAHPEMEKKVYFVEYMPPDAAKGETNESREYQRRVTEREVHYMREFKTLERLGYGGLNIRDDIADGWLEIRRLGAEASRKDFLPFEAARVVARGRGLKGVEAWREWCKSGDSPLDIPSCPNIVYRGKGWVSWPDWLGYIDTSGNSSTFLAFEDARATAQELGLKDQMEWRQWCKSGDRPRDIPSHPERTYSGKGWVSWMDWLGYERRRKRKKARLI